MSEPITQERAEKALHFLAHTDEQAAYLKVEAKKAELKWKKTKAALFLIADGSVANKTAFAETHEKADEAEANYLDAEQKYQTLQNRRESAKLVFECWRSLNANRRQGA